jgi:hypothetical protein
MRLDILDRGHSFKAKALFAMIRVMSGHRAEDVVRTVMYRPEFFGKYNNKMLHEVMRGPSEWSVGERELMAAFISKTNECEF